MSSAYGIDLLNELIIDLNEFNPSVLKSSNDEFKEIVNVYGNFIYSAFSLFNKDLNETLDKKAKYIFGKVI